MRAELQFSMNYTYSKALDEVSDVFTNKNGGTGIPTPYNPSITMARPISMFGTSGSR